VGNGSDCTAYFYIFSKDDEEINRIPTK